MRPSKKTPRKIEKLRAARAAGKSLRVAAEAAGISHESARAWLQRDSARKAKRNGKGRSTSPALVESKGSSHAAPDVSAAVVSAPLPNALADVQARHATVRALLERLTPAVEEDTYPATAFIALARYADDAATRISELTPAAPTDPASDPSNAAAAAQVREKFALMVQAAEAEFRCQSCGGSPYGKG